MGKATRLLGVAEPPSPPGWGVRSRATLTFVQLSVPIPALLRRVSGTVSLTPRSPVARYDASVHLAPHVCACAPPRGRWVSVSIWHAPAGDDIACGAQKGNVTAA
eukprot:6214265-Pleurochrysis_carterae.AAC.2